MKKQIGWANIQNKYVYLAAVIDLRGPPRADPLKKYPFNPTLKWLCLCCAETWLYDGERCCPTLNHRHYSWMSPLSQSVLVRWNCHILCGRETLVLTPFGYPTSETWTSKQWNPKNPLLGEGRTASRLRRRFAAALRTSPSHSPEAHLVTVAPVCVCFCHDFFFSFF